MNAISHPAAGTRYPFSAFLCDPATLDTVNMVATALNWPHERIHEGSLRNAAQSLAVSASPAILLVDLSDTAEPEEEINGLAQVCEPGTVVIACGTINDVRYYRSLIGYGIHDYLLKPFTADQLQEVIAQVQQSLAAPRVADTAAADRPHMITAVIGARGGVGASSIATSIAWLFGELAGHSTAFLDLDIHFGTGALAFDLEPGRGLVDAVENPARIDGLFLERAMVRASPHVSILSAEAPINQPLLGDGSAFLQLQEEIKGSFQCAVVDLPRHMLVQHPLLMQDSAGVVIVADLTLAAARDTIRLLSWLKANAARTKPIIVANKMPLNGATEISQRDFETTIERKIDVLLPFDAKLVVQAAKLGKPLAEVAKGSKLGQGLVTIAERLLALGGGEIVTSAQPGKSLLGKMGGFKALLAPRKAK
jgi:pilus assembly protein CpaE